MVQSNNNARHISAQEATESTGLLPRPTQHYTSPAYWKTMVISAPFTAAAINFTWRKMISSGAIPPLLSSCPTFPIHTGVNPLDKFLCGSVSFLQAGLDPSNPPFLGGYMSSFTTCAIIPLIESQRMKTPGILSQPAILGVVSQVLGRATVYPTWWSLFVSSGGARRTPEESVGSEIDQYDAEGALVAVLIGFSLPALKFVTSRSSGWTLTWFLYPFTISLLRAVYPKLRRHLSGSPKDVKDSQELGYTITMLTYAVDFICATVPHLIVLVPRAAHPDMLKALFGLNANVPEDANTSFIKVVFHTIQWDGLITFVSSLVATLSFSRSKWETLGLTVWNFASAVMFGTGGSLTGVWAWREMRMKSEREQLSATRRR
ncbi:hypothetical protein BD410DRAFT_546088 [Rickenella mellea]|uniref:Uncharacterized protein n=1 Tax=Rickenella mellea TaxID=50990 RepID=A0A4Y7PQ15_9AGAM|nr:hypothetical protein BD410DRAFT_546088 [Rickenella mellea]